jgi:ribonuclease HII
MYTNSFCSAFCYDVGMIIGIDEVGRGPIAGPVCVAAFLIHQPAAFARLVEKVKKQTKLPLRDSKKLSKVQREAWVLLLEEWQKAGKCDFAITLIQPKTIDRIGIAPSIKQALEISLTKVTSNIPAKNKPKKNLMILLDGGLKAPPAFARQKTIIKGDEKEDSIAFASIVAKVHRDNVMTKLAKKHPAYGFESHVGYGTKAHYAAIKKYGRLPAHRASFLTRFLS